MSETKQEVAGSIRDRLLVALADPDIASKNGRSPATLVALQSPLTVFEWPLQGKGLVVLDLAGLPDQDLRAHIDRILLAHEKGLLFIAVVGGNAQVSEVLAQADREARNRDRLGSYWLDDAGKAHHVAGRRLSELEKACRNLPTTHSLSTEDIAQIIERSRNERQEAVDFVRGNTRRFPHVTVAIIAICFLLFALTSSQDLRAQRLFLLLCNSSAAVRHGEVWRLLTYALLHAPVNPTHIIVNMLSLYSLGGFLEPVLGQRRFALLFAVSALAGGVASSLFGVVVSVGASGAVWGLMGATFGLVRGPRRYFPALIARSLRQRLLVVLAINVVFSFLPNIDRYCHFGGGIAGYLLAMHFARKGS